MVKRKPKEPDRYARSRARYAKRAIYLNKNIRVQLLSKAKKEGWIFEKTIFSSFYSFHSPDEKIRMAIDIETIFPPHKVHFFNIDENPRPFIEAIAEASYKYYLRYGSEMILTEALL